MHVGLNIGIVLQKPSKGQTFTWLRLQSENFVSFLHEKKNAVIMPSTAKYLLKNPKYESEENIESF